MVSGVCLTLVQLSSVLASLLGRISPYDGEMTTSSGPVVAHMLLTPVTKQEKKIPLCQQSKSPRTDSDWPS
jgi:hypothetical protein